jgi:peptidoglycan/LPS O-acetylase OafA/YrhL
MIPEMDKVARVGSRRFPILDALRFVLAFWVLMGHFGLPPFFAGVDQTRLVFHLIARGYSSIVWGMTAVICFFVISGFCIHLPFRHEKKLPVARFYLRRYVRILIPVIVGVVLFRLSGNHDPLFGAKSVWWNTVLWSLLCEEIYYGIYPATLWFVRRFGWTWLLGPAFALSLTLTLTHPYRIGWEAFGPWQTAVILYPVWILGCLLAEQSDRLRSRTKASEIWRWRFGVWACAWACEILNFKTRVHFPQTMVLFGVAVYFWLKKEIALSKDEESKNAFMRLLVAGGAWSYSLYLMHLPMMTILLRLRLPNLPPLVKWCVATAFVLITSYIFFLAIERPSHWLARRLGRLELRTKLAQETTPSPKPLVSA